MRHMRKGELVRSLVLTALAVFVMFIILFPVYYIFVVSISPGSTLATTEFHLIPQNVSLDSYREVLFGFKGSKISENFTGTIEGSANIQDGKLYITNGRLIGKVRYGPFTGLTFEIPLSSAVFEVSAGENVQGQLKGNVKGLFVLTRVNDDGSIGFGLVRNLEITSGELGGASFSGILLQGPTGKNYIVIRNGGKVTFTRVGMFVNSVFFGYLKNSLIIAGLAVLLTLIFVVPAAYAFSRMKFFGRDHVLYFYLMFTQVAGGLGIAGLIALYGMIVKLGLYDKLPVLSFIYAAGGVPFNTWLLKGYIDSISPDFDEAALVDGASYLQIIRYVLLPMALPGIATVAIFAFIGGWTEFILASLLLTEKNQPLAVWIYLLMGGIGRGIDWSYFGAAALLFALPVFIMFMLAQNYIRSGLTIGGLKE
ncbi:sugar ABC transporter permease [Thermococcus thioreducens]|uniref:Cyclodextrin ABC transporter membrane protein n=1 Tax=Thermococcus thioreducens TaxID=277988 RepID=A0A0Q2S2V3_9EURY|nr:sugar ABC transporter permease [Thermococcus thioreducens]ASJ11541.1 sugar transporter [Thermococcus thioreducens]KQH81851.1 sugar transporter [Thermococcus thioreducens]SEW04875.1 cyclodextrin ABC transporter membrane protein [Thermococcus thioreducens]